MFQSYSCAALYPETMLDIYEGYVWAGLRWMLGLWVGPPWKQSVKNQNYTHFQFYEVHSVWAAFDCRCAIEKNLHCSQRQNSQLFIAPWFIDEDWCLQVKALCWSLDELLNVCIGRRSKKTLSVWYSVYVAVYEAHGAQSGRVCPVLLSSAVTFTVWRGGTSKPSFWTDCNRFLLV